MTDKTFYEGISKEIETSTQYIYSNVEQINIHTVAWFEEGGSSFGLYQKSKRYSKEYLIKNITGNYSDLKKYISLVHLAHVDKKYFNAHKLISDCPGLESSFFPQFMNRSGNCCYFGIGLMNSEESPIKISTDDRYSKIEINGLLEKAKNHDFKINEMLGRIRSQKYRPNSLDRILLLENMNHVSRNFLIYLHHFMTKLPIPIKKEIQID